MRKRMASFSGLAVAVVLSLGGTAPAVAQQVVKLGEGETLTISGFLNATLFNDRGLFGAFGQGQNAEYAAAPVGEPGFTTPPGVFQTQPGARQSIMDGDVRNSRIRFDFSAPPVLGKWAPRATLESDFFGAFNGVPPFGDEAPQLRVRFAYADFTNGRTTLRIGQFWAPLFGETPVSLTHLAFPLGYGGSGKVGWRFPGVFLYHDLITGQPVNVQLQVAAMKGAGPAAAGRDAANGIGNGEASGAPQFETLLNFTKKSEHLSWNGYAVWHIDWKNPTGTGVSGSNFTSWAVEAGGGITPGSFTLHGNFYFGKDQGQNFAHIAQQGNVRGWGAWAQGGYDFTPHWSFWLFYGMDQPDYARFARENGVALSRQLNHDSDALLRFRAGRYAVGLEYFRSVTRWSTATTSADQYALSVMYTL